MTQLTPFPDEKFEAWRQTQREKYILEKMKANGFTRQEAEEIADSQLTNILKDGLQSKDQYIYEVLNEGEVVGFLWFGLTGSQENRKAYVWEIEVHPEHRGKGLGRKTMEILEEKVKELGVDKIGLHVFAHNQLAWDLYGSMGYKITDIVMEKDLGKV